MLTMLMSIKNCKELIAKNIILLFSLSFIILILNINYIIRSFIFFIFMHIITYVYRNSEKKVQNKIALNLLYPHIFFYLQLYYQYQITTLYQIFIFRSECII